MTSIQIFQEGVDLSSFDDSKLPSDIHMVHFTKEDGSKQVDAVRGYTMTDIFDAYHDKKLKVTKIQAGYGRVRPNLYGKIQADE